MVVVQRPFGDTICISIKKNILNIFCTFTYVLNKEKPRLIHAHFGPQGVAMIPIKRWLKLPLITTFYGFDVTQLPREDIWNEAYQKLFKEGDLFLVEGNNMKQSLMEIGCSSEKS